MIMEIHSSLGVLRCRELEKQAIENSIPEGQVQEQNKDIQATADDQDAVSPASVGNN